MIDIAKFENAREYALRRLESELPEIIYYHSLAHTHESVFPEAQLLAHMEGISHVDFLLVSTAAVFHDIGFVEQAHDHEEASMRIASEALPEFGYAFEEIQAILGMIQATRLPQSPRNLLERILADADLAILGRENFLSRNRDLRRELQALGRSFTDEEWFRAQLAFISNHAYFTASARKLHSVQKTRNIAAMQALLAEAQPDETPQPLE